MKIQRLEVGKKISDFTLKNQDNKDVKLSKAQKIGLKHFEDFELRIPREEIAMAEVKVQKLIKEKLGEKFTATVCGSYRR